MIESDLSETWFLTLQIMSSDREIKNLNEILKNFLKTSKNTCHPQIASRFADIKTPIFGHFWAQNESQKYPDFDQVLIKIPRLSDLVQN